MSQTLKYVEPSITPILLNAFESGDPADRSSARQFCNAVQILINENDYFQTQFIDGTGSRFTLQPCDSSGTPMARFMFTYSNCYYMNSGAKHVTENDDKNFKPKSLSLWKKLKNCFW